MTSFLPHLALFAEASFKERMLSTNINLTTRNAKIRYLHSSLQHRVKPSYMYMYTQVITINT